MIRSSFFICIFLFINSILFSQIIVIDPGHGYNSSGGDPDGRTATEHATALAVGLRLNTILSNDCPNWTSHLTRTTANGWITLTQRASMSNSWNADYFLSVHCNGGGGTGTETFWCDQNDNSSTDDITFAQKIQSKMVQHGNWISRRCVEDDSYIFHLAVLKNSNATGCLSEIGFVDSGDATKLNSNSWRDSFTLAYKKAFENLEGSCSPSNTVATSDYCSTAYSLISSNSCSNVNGSLLGASTTFSTKASCDAASSPALKDVFYRFTANSSAHTILVSPTGNGANAVDAVVSLYSGADCSSLTEISCAGGSGGSGGVVKQLNANGLMVGQDYWIRIYDYGTIDPTDYNFQICVTSTTTVTSFQELSEKENDIYISPNPTTGIFSITHFYEKPVEYKIVNSLSQIIETGNLENTKGLIDISNQPNGLYFIYINNQTDKQIVKKLIKQ